MNHPSTRVSRPPGGASSIRFGSDEDTSHVQTEKASSVKNHMKSNILFDDIIKSAPAEQPAAAAGIVEEGIFEPSTAGEAAVPGDNQKLQAAGDPPQQVKEEAEATGGVNELKNGDMEKGKLAALNAEPDEGNATPNIDSNIQKTGDTQQQQPASRVKIPPGGYSTLKLW